MNETSTIRFSPHSRERMSQYKVGDHEVVAALGVQIVDDVGHLRCPDAAADHEGWLRFAPMAGRPVRIGRCVPDPRWRRTSLRSTLLVVTPAGRRLHVVCAPYSERRLEIITTWDPDDQFNAGLWLSHAQLPTADGNQSLVPTRWCLGDPTDPRRHQFRPRTLD